MRTMSGLDGTTSRVVRSPAAADGGERQQRRLQRVKWQRGQGMVEYALILVLVALAVIAALTFLGGQISGVFHNITTILQQNGPH